MTDGHGPSIRVRIDAVVQQAELDARHAHDLFNYTWAMVCVEQGLLRIVKDLPAAGPGQIVVEEVRSGRHRVLTKPLGLDGDVERLAVEAMARILAGPALGA